ncbi:hypothetical protein M569_04686, partial [Genlisea aurea]
RKKIRQRKFIMAKKKSKNLNSDPDPILHVACEKCKIEFGKSRCLCSVYESLKASQEEFFKNQNQELSSFGLENETLSENSGDSGIKRSRDEVLEEARQSIPEAGSGRVMHLVKAFEKLGMIPKSEDEFEEEK